MRRKMFFGFLQRSWSLTANKKIRFNRGLRSLESLHTGSPLRRERRSEKKKPSFWPWSRRNYDDKDKLKITQSQKCEETGSPILDPECKVAIVVGGAADIGLSAADSLLYHGARAVIIVDEDSRVGENAARSLCDFYGKNRALFLRCCVGNSCQFEGVFEKTICRYKTVDVLFSNLDRNNSGTMHRSICEDTENQSSNTMKAIHTGMQYMGKTNNGSGGIIINAASIVGFMGWPIDPTPVYCFKEPVVETTMDLAKIYPVERTGVRMVALLKSNKPIAEVGLPDFPKTNKKINLQVSQYLEPSAVSRIGKALVHVMARAKTGTTWLSEPPPCLRETPWLIHFPTGDGETIDPGIYEQQNYSIAFGSRCVVPSTGNCAASCHEIECNKVSK